MRYPSTPFLFGWGNCTKSLLVTSGKVSRCQLAVVPSPWPALEVRRSTTRSPNTFAASLLASPMAPTRMLTNIVNMLSMASASSLSKSRLIWARLWVPAMMREPLERPSDIHSSKAGFLGRLPNSSINSHSSRQGVLDSASVWLVISAMSVLHSGAPISL